ncbi:MAG: tetratricopeptide repeat protein [Candidatus Latescibacterota bacterium]|nr:MAG: tetratricopeptide repeat protein [Candidatus Latescibacterota bacterium]
MRHLTRVPLWTCIVCAAMGAASAHAAAPATRATGIGFETALGAGTAALVDPGAALFENPAALARASRWQTLLGGGHDDGLESLRFGAAGPTLSGPTWGVGFTRWWRSGDATSLSSRGDTGLVGAAWAHPSGLAAGGALKLLNSVEEEASDTSFGADVGVHWDGSGRKGTRGAWSHVTAGIALLNAVEPQVHLHDREATASRELRAAAAWTQPLRPAWSGAVSIGIQAPRHARRAFSAAARVNHVAGVQLAFGVHDGDARAGAAFERNAWRLGYALTSEGSKLGHHLLVQMRWGPTLAERRLARAHAREIEVASELARAVSAREQSELEGWMLEARRELDAGRFDRAATLYGMVLARRPYDARARRGRRDARHAALVQEADSLLQRSDFMGAARALEGALVVVPEDSVSASRLRGIRLAVRDASRMRSEVQKRYHAGIDAYAQQRYLEAARVFAEVLELDPEHPTAASYRQQALSAHELRVQVAMRNARNRFDAGDDGPARVHVNRVLELEPQHAEAKRLLAALERRAEAARLALAQERQRQQQAELEDSAPAVVVPTAEVKARYEEGMRLYRSGDLFGAMGAWEQVAQAVPQYEEVASYLLRVYRVTGLESYTEGRLQEAVEIWDKALQLEPENVQVRRYLNRAHAKLARARSTEGTRP